MTDVFVETLSFTQSQNAAAAYSMYVYSGCSYYQIYSFTSMTVDICVQICAGYGFNYAGLEK
jgi:hypothetical protein